MAITFESYERRIEKINKVCAEYGLSGLEEAKALCDSKGINVDAIVKGIQPIAFENAVWAYTLGAAIALKRAARTQPKPPKTSVSVSKRSAFPAPSPTAAT